MIFENQKQPRFGLVFDCLNEWLQVALIRQGQGIDAEKNAHIVRQKQGIARRDTFRHLTAWIEEIAAPDALFSQQDAISPHRLDHIVIAIKEGSFTGLRLAANTASSLSQLLNLPVYSASALDFYYKAAQQQLMTLPSDGTKAQAASMTQVMQPESASTAELEAKSESTAELEAKSAFTAELEAKSASTAELEAKSESVPVPVLFLHRYGEVFYCKIEPGRSQPDHSGVLLGKIGDLVQQWQISPNRPLFVQNAKIAQLVAQIWPASAATLIIMKPPSLLHLTELAWSSPPIDWQGCASTVLS